MRIKQHKINKQTHHVAIFDSVHEIASETLKASKIKTGDRHTHDVDRASFLGRAFSSLDEACSAATKPWDEGIKMVSEMIVELRKSVKLPRPVSLKRKRVWSFEDGDEIDIHRLRVGKPFYRSTEKSNSVKAKQLTIFIDICANASKKHKQLLWRGIAAITIARLLEDAGYRTAIHVYDSAERGFTSGKGMSTLVNVKDMKDMLNIGTLASAVSAWFFRSVGFHAYNVFDDEPSYGLGSHNEKVGELLDLVEPDADKRLNISKVWSRSEAVSLVESVINRLNSEADKKLAAV